MEDFNHIEHDPIPEGLEFNESYMQSAFALYDAEKQKRKRRILIWWITSALGFSSILLIGMYFFTRTELSGSAVKRIPSDNRGLAQKITDAKQDSDQKELFQNGKPTAADASKKQLPESSKASGKATPVIRQNLLSGTASDNIRTHGNETSGSRSRQHVTYESRKIKNVVSAPDEGQKTDPTFVKEPESDLHHETNETVNSDSIVLFDAVNLPVKAAIESGDSVRALPAHEPPFSETAEIPLRRHQVFMTLGVNTLFGMKELQHRATFRESIGVSYNYRINEKWAVGAGLEYHSISRISYKRIIGDTLNSDKTTTILNKTTLNYISLLPQVNYRLGKKHQISAGFGIEYLLTDPGERYEIQNYTNEDPKRTNSKLYYSTFNRFNFSASVGYSYQFSPFMSVVASYHFGFTDITINNGYNNTFDRNSRLHLGLKIKLH